MLEIVGVRATGGPVGGGLATAVIVASLVLAGWGALTAVLNRAPGVTHLAGAAVVEVLALVLVGAAVARLLDGQRPAALATFIGYLLIAALIVPGGVGLALMEPSRWGTVIVAAACLILPVLVVRLQQVWAAAGG